MRVAANGMWAVAAVLFTVTLGGCPTGVGALEYVAGGTGEATVLRSTASVNVLTPVSNLSIAGGTQVEVNWQAFARTRTSALNIIVDEDEDPNNGNEISAYSNVPLTQTQALVDTTRLKRGAYTVGVTLTEVGEIIAVGYAPGRIIIDQRPDLYFNQPTQAGLQSVREPLAFDRTAAVIPQFFVSWNMCDPDSTNTVQIFLDPDDTPNGNEILLYTSNKAADADGCAADSFTFDFPTSVFVPGLYRILAIVSDGTRSTVFYAPGSVRVRGRLAGYVDLRDLSLGTGALNGAVFEGFNPRDNTGSFVSTITDIDGDGFEDFIIVAQFAKPRYGFSTQRTGLGEAYLVYGRNDPFSGAINLNSTGTLFRGEVYEGVPEAPDPIRPSRGITSFALLSDWDNDGVREMAFGLPFTDSLSIGGYALGPAGNNIAPLDVNGYFRTGAVVVAAGSSLRPDVGFPGRNVFNLAEFGTLAHVSRSCGICISSDACGCFEGFYGPKAPAPIGGCRDTKFHEHIVIDVNGAPNVGSVRLGCRFSSNGFGDQFGESVSAWDFDAIIMSAPNRDPFVSLLRPPGHIPGAGVISAFYVDVKDGFYPWTNTNAPAANQAQNYRGSTPSAGGRLLPHGGPYHYIIDDLATGVGYNVDPDDGEPCGLFFDAHMSTPERSVRFWSSVPGARLSSARGIGDVNADGLVDLLIGAPLANAGAGACYVVLGRIRELVMGGELQLEELAAPMSSSSPGQARIFDGLQIVGAPNERLGQSQDDAGDFNNDGFGDVVAGSPLLNNRKGGAVVFFGSREVINLTQTEIPANELPARGLGVVFEGEEDGDLAGGRVAGVGDIDGDGNDDILIAAPNRSVRLDLDLDGTPEIDRRECGVVYLVYGHPDLIRRRCLNDNGVYTEPGRLLLKYIGTETLPGAVFIGRNSGDHLGAGLGLQGDRSTGMASAGDVNGDGRRDLLLGSVDASPRDRAKAGEVYLIYGAGN